MDEPRSTEPQRRKDAKALEPTPRHNEVARLIVDAAFAAHSALGPGLLESVYEQCIAIELRRRDLKFELQVALPIVYQGTRIDAGFRMDMVIEHMVVLEIKAIEKTLPIHEAQLLTYLKLSGHRLGFLINFNVVRIRDGIRRLVLS
jgi:GxxExxY protein